MLVPESKPFNPRDPSGILENHDGEPTPEQIARFADMSPKDLAADAAEETLFDAAFSEVEQLGS